MSTSPWAAKPGQKKRGRPPKANRITPVKKRGRPPKTIDCKIVEKLATIHCTQQEIAAVLGVSQDTLVNETNGVAFAEAFERGWQRGKESLRRAQWKSAIDKGNVTMQIWLGKNMLGQRDIVITEQRGEIKYTEQSPLKKLSTGDLHKLRELITKASQSESEGTIQ